jgi:subtilisin family serine protease
MNGTLNVPAQDEQYQNFIIKYNQNIHGPIDYVSDGTFQIINDFYAVLYVPDESLPEMEINSYSYNSVPNCYTYMDLEALQASGVTRLQDHPYLKLRGKGTLIAIIDSGIDYTNPLFLDGDRSRILAIWDQSIPGGASDLAPYGKVFLKEEIDTALASEDPLEIVPSTDENGHGTMLAALAAGSRDTSENFSGAAPEASILVVKLKQAKRYLRDFYLYPRDVDLFQEDDIMLGISFAIVCANRFRLPLSICLGIGSSQGAHLGKSPLCQYINSTADYPQNVVSIAAGNEGTARHHYEGRLTEMRSQDIVELRVGEEKEGFTLELWGMPPELYGITIQSPTGESLEVCTTLRSRTQELAFVFVETRVLVNYVEIERLTGNTLVYFRFLHPAAGIWKFYVSGKTGKNSTFHMWLPVQGLISPEIYFLESSPYTTITTPGDAQGGITVTAYRDLDNSLYLMASRGYLPDGTIKPDFAAPGVDVKVPLLNGSYGTASGTSLAAAQSAGIAALLFEWAVVRGNEPFFYGTSVKYYLQRGVKQEEGRQYPNPDWGYGRVDLYHSFELLS